MKWYKKSIGTWSLNNKYTAKKHNYSFKIIGNSIENEYYIMIEDTKTNNILNSLWKNISFEKLEEAKSFCEEYAKDFKEKRITIKIKNEWINNLKNN